MTKSMLESSCQIVDEVPFNRSLSILWEMSRFLCTTNCDLLLSPLNMADLPAVAMLRQMRQLMELLASNSVEHTTLDRLLGLIEDRTTWKSAQELFNEIRRKTLAAEQTGSSTLTAQYLFEEVCAKSLYNWSSKKPIFDSHCMYWIVPNALVAAMECGIPLSTVASIVGAGKRKLS